MYSQAAQAYGQTAKQTVPPRSLESDLLMKAAARLQAISEDWAARGGELDEALAYNKKLWTVFVSSVLSKDNPLPEPIKENVANLGVFVFSQTYELGLAPAPEKLSSLISINREIAAGLRGE